MLQVTSRRELLEAFGLAPVAAQASPEKGSSSAKSEGQAVLSATVWADFSRITVPDQCVALLTSGYATRGIGAARYVIDSDQTTQTSRSWRRRSANGRWFRLDLDGQRLNVTMFGAGLGAADEVRAFEDAAVYAAGRRVHVPSGDYNLGPWTMVSDSHFEGDGAGSHLRFVHREESHFILINNIVRVSLSSMRINGNEGRLTGGARKGAAISISNEGGAFAPRDNDVVIEQCLIEGNGFTAIGGYNAHAVKALFNRVRGAGDTGIAAVEGCSKWTVIGNDIDGFSFGISFSNNGSTNATRVGRVRRSTITHNVCRASKAKSYGMEFDGIEDCIVAENCVVLDGGGYGVRVVISGDRMPQPSAASIKGNVVVVLKNIPSSAFEFQGLGDASGLDVAGNVVRSEALADEVHGLTLIGGANLVIASHKSINVRSGVYIEHLNVACTIRVGQLEAEGCSVGILAPSTAAAKCRLIIERGHFDKTVNYSAVIGSGFHLDLRGTSLHPPFDLKAASAKGMQEFGSSALVGGQMQVRFNPPKPDADYVISLSSSAFDPVGWSMKTPGGFRITSRDPASRALVDWAIRH